MKDISKRAQLVTALIMAVTVLVITTSFFIADAKDLHKKGTLGLPPPHARDRSRMNQIVQPNPPFSTTTPLDEPRP